MSDQFRHFFKTAAIYGLASIVGRAIGFLMIPVYTHYLSPEDYGVVEILDLFTTVLGSIIAGATGMSLFNFYHNAEDDAQRHDIVATAITLVLGCTCLFSVLGIMYSGWLTELLFKGLQHQSAVRIILLTFIFENVSVITLSYIRAQNRAILYICISLAKLLVGLSLNIYFIVFLGKGFYGLLYGSLITNGLAMTGMLIYSFKQVGLSFSFLTASRMLAYGLPLVPSSLGMFIIHFGDRFFLQRYAAMTDVGLYALSYKLGFLINFLVILPFSLMWDSKMFQIQQSENAKQIYARAFTYLWAMLLFVYTGMTLLTRDVLGFIVAPEFYEAYRLVPIIGFAYVLNGSCYYFRMSLYLKKNTHLISLIMVITTAITLLLYRMFIPVYGAFGAALSTAAAFLCWTLFTFLCGQKVYHVPYEWKRIVKAIMVSILLLFGGYFIHFESGILNLTVKALLGLSFPILLFLLRFFEVEERKGLLSLKQRLFTKRI